LNAELIANETDLAIYNSSVDYYCRNWFGIAETERYSYSYLFYDCVSDELLNKFDLSEGIVSVYEWICEWKGEFDGELYGEIERFWD
jgi:hypothetical protein